jgi:hypothetical protein
MKPVPTYELLLWERPLQQIPLPSLVNFSSRKTPPTENMGQGTSECGVGSNHRDHLTAIANRRSIRNLHH